jgi:LTXXQ motif family protein
MRLWTLPIVGAVALSLALPSTADARLRFGPGALLGAVAGAMFGGFRHSGRHHRHSATHASMSHRGTARWARHPAPAAAQRPASAPQAATNTPKSRPNAPAEPPRASAAALFWPEAATDLADYVLFADGNDRFWTYGYDTIIGTAFAGPQGEDQRSVRGRPAAGRTTDGAKAPIGPAELCGATSANADALIDQIERAVGPNASQRGALGQLRRALAQAIERITTTCPTAMPTSIAERLNEIQNRIWAMHDALLTVRLPLETFYNSLSDEQRQQLRQAEPQTAQRAADVTEGRGRTAAEAHAPTCAEPGAGSADWIMRAVERAAPPDEQQRAGLEMLRLRSSAMAQLIAASCPTNPHLDPVGRFAAAADRLNLTLFAVMSMSPALQQLYDSLDPKQKASLSRALGQARRSGAAGARS